MITEEAVALNIHVILGGRDNKQLAALASGLGVPSTSFTLEDTQVIDTILQDVTVVINCAGPYRYTAETLMTAAIRTKTHYLDISAELDSYVLAQSLSNQAQAAGVMLLPGCGGSVAMPGCLAGHAMKRANSPQRISVALHVSGPMSRGSVGSAAAGIPNACLRREDGQLIPSGTTQIRDFDFGLGPVSCFPLTLPDLLTIGHATRVPDIDTFVHLSGGAFPQDDATPSDGPTTSQREANPYQAAVEVTSGDGSIVSAILDTVNGYTFTALAAAKAADRVVNGESRLGFQTPAELFGSGFVETMVDSRIIDV